MSSSTENFLKSIYQLTHDDGKKASSTNLARALDISHAAVTDMAKKLSAKGLVDYRKYKEITLTSQGMVQALNVIRRHRLWESFLHEVLDLPAMDVHKEAENLEHQSSDYLMDKIDEYLGHPDFDPNGDPIPDARGNLPETDSIPLSEARKGERYTIRRMRFNDHVHQNFFTRNKIKVGSEIRIEDIADSGHSIVIEFADRQIILPSNFAKSIQLISH